MPNGSTFPHFSFVTPNVPDLGCLIERAHGFEEDFDFHAWPELSPIAAGAHQAYVRVKCGDAGFFQRAGVAMRQPGDDLISVLNLPPDEVLGGDFRPRPSDWIKFAPQLNTRRYWLMGEHRNPAVDRWEWDSAVGHSYDIYENGTLSTVGWDDTGVDRDFDDLVLEIAVVRRDALFAGYRVAVAQEAVAERFKELADDFQKRHGKDHEVSSA